ncbi:MAG: membrane protein insertase YidC [bacterium]|nr:membrane protein insertase YidC [bacterium]
MEKKTVLAIALSILVWVGWAYFFGFGGDPKKPAKIPAKQEETSGTQAAKETSKPAAAKKQDTRKTTITKTTIPGKNIPEADFTHKTDKFDIVFTNKGASMKQVKFIEQNNIECVPDISKHDRKDLNNKKFPNAKGGLDFPIHFNDEEFLKGSDLDSAVWDHKKEEDGSIRFFTTLERDGVLFQIEKIYRFTKDGDAFNLKYRILNTSKKDLSFPDDLVIFSPGDFLGPVLDYDNKNNILMSIYSPDGKDSEDFSKSGEPVMKVAENTNWIGVRSRYFLVVMIPEDFTGAGAVGDGRSTTGFRTGLLTRVENIAPGQSVDKSFKVYLGVRDKSRLAAVDERIKDAADIYMIIEPIRLFVIWCLLGINSFVGNFGWSIVIFSLLSKLVFLPLTQKSTRSMQKMQGLTPKINEIKKKYKDDPTELNKKTMALYKEHGVNPMGGCLPILVQMPFFMGLYSALINSVDLYNAPFILWIKDLSMPDTVMTINHSFSFLSTNLNILPIVMTVTTLLQQKLTTVDTGQGQQQKIMMTMLPLVFIFIFWSMPSGLVLYWTLQNIFQVAHQLITNKMKAKKQEA